MKTAHVELSIIDEGERMPEGVSFSEGNARTTWFLKNGNEVLVADFFSDGRPPSLQVGMRSKSSDKCWWLEVSEINELLPESNRV